MGATSKSYVEEVRKEAREKRLTEVASIWKTFLRPALGLFYGAVIAAALLAAIIICRT
jgi:hypothetical protein